MTVRELINELEKFKDDLEVWTQYESYGRNGVIGVCLEQGSDEGDHVLLKSDW